MTDSTMTGKGACDADEPGFTLRARNPLAPAFVEMWATLSEQQGEHPARIAEARAIAGDMRRWRAARVLDQHVPLDQTPAMPAARALEILIAVCQASGLTRTEILGDGRAKAIAGPRQLLMLLTQRETGASLPVIGRWLNRDHTTVMHGIAAAKRRLEKDPDYRSLLDRVEIAIHEVPVPSVARPAEPEVHGTKACSGQSKPIDRTVRDLCASKDQPRPEPPAVPVAPPIPSKLEPAAAKPKEPRAARKARHSQEARGRVKRPAAAEEAPAEKIRRPQKPSKPKRRIAARPSGKRVQAQSSRAKGITAFECDVLRAIINNPGIDNYGLAEIFHNTKLVIGRTVSALTAKGFVLRGGGHALAAARLPNGSPIPKADGDEDGAKIAAFLAKKGSTKCPTVVVEPGGKYRPSEMEAGL